MSTRADMKAAQLTQASPKPKISKDNHKTPVQVNIKTNPHGLMAPHEEDDLRINEPTNASRLERDMVQSSDHMFNQSSIQMANDGTPGLNARFADGPANLLDSPNHQENNFGASDDE